MQALPFPERARRLLDPVTDPVAVAVGPEPGQGDNDHHRKKLLSIAEAFAAFGTVTRGTGQSLDADVETYGTEWVSLAVTEAAMAKLPDGPPGWRYVHRILERWETEGGPDARTRNGLHTPEPADSRFHAESIRLGLDKPPVMVANPFVKRDADGKVIREMDSPGASNG